VATTPLIISVSRLEALCTEAFRRAGLSDVNAASAADVLVTTDSWGVFTHGTKALRGYVRRLLAGGLRPDGRPSVIQEGPAWALVDGDSSLGLVTSVFAMHKAIEKARASGTAYVGVRNSSHFGAAGYYSSLAAEAGLIGMAMANDIPSVAAPGSAGAITGSNPFSFAVPAARHRPLFLDMSVATVAGGKVYAARERGESIPSGWLIDAAGKPTTDANAYPEYATLTPAAGHKGYGLALLVETLSGCLTGAQTTWGIRSWLAGDLGVPTMHGAAFLVIEPAAMASDLPQRVSELIDEIHGAERADGVERIFVPGEMEWERRERALREGIALPSDVVASLRDLQGLVGLDLADYADSGDPEDSADDADSTRSPAQRDVR
jgi:ureidoglycolate dehydrogenase (NAD+)